MIDFLYAYAGWQVATSVDIDLVYSPPINTYSWHLRSHVCTFNCHNVHITKPNQTIKSSRSVWTGDGMHGTMIVSGLFLSLIC